MSVKKAIITAAGFGSRFLPFTKSVPKEMLPLVDKPIIHHLVEECAEAGIEEVIIVASSAEVAKFDDYFLGRATHIRSLMIRQNKLDRWEKVERVFKLPHVTVIPQDERLAYGNGSPVLSAKDLLVNDEAFVVIFGDDLVLSKESATKQLVGEYEKEKPDAVIGVQQVDKESVSKFGIVELKKGTKSVVKRLIEKPDPETASSRLAQYGRFIFTNRIFDYLHPDGTGKDGELWIGDATDQLARNGRVLCKQVEGEWMTTGDPLSYTKAFLKFAMADQKIGEEIQAFVENI